MQPRLNNRFVSVRTIYVYFQNSTFCMDPIFILLQYFSFEFSIFYHTGSMSLPVVFPILVRPTGW